MDQTVSNSGFVGDMSYPGDGGDTLQRLYELWHWSEIPNCPGRYVTKRNTVAEAISPINLLQLLGTTDQIYEYIILETVSGVRIVLPLHSFEMAVV
jgi:hypothetical protein